MEKARIPFGNPEAERMVALISLLQAVTAAANEARSPETAIQTCLDLVCRYLVWPVGHCYRVAPGGRGDLVDTDLWHIERPEVMNRFRELTASTAMPCDAGLPGRVIETGEPVWIADLTSDPNLVRRGSSADVPLRAAFGFPVVVGKETVAVLEFFNEHVTPPDARLLETLPQIGMQLGRAFERERSERALRESEDLYRDLVESSNDMICTHDMSGTILTANPAMARFFGIAREELIGRDLSDFIAAEVRDEFPEYLVRVRNESAVTGLMKVDGAAGETRVIEYFNTRRVDGVSEPIVRGVARDVTDSYLARRGLVGSERRFRLTFERSLAGICHLTLGGEVLDSNDAFARLLDYDR